MFSSINLGTCTRAGGRLATKALLKAIDAGIGRGVTSLFPIVIFKLKDGVSFSPGDPNYDLRLISESVTAKRMFPNYSNLDAPYNLKYYKEGHPETEVAYMGCAHADETVRINYKDKTSAPTIGNLFSTLCKELYINPKEDVSTYIDTSALNLRVWDSSIMWWTQCKGILRNPKTKNWLRIVMDTEPLINLLVTKDHPFPVKDKGRVIASDLQVGDVLQLEDEKGYAKILTITEEDMEDYCYDVETYSDKFDLSGIVSHNCRTRVISNVNGPEIVTDRGNLSFTTLNLPRYAIEAMKEEPDNEEARIKLFFEKLNTYEDVAAKQLLHRYKIQSNRHVYNFPYVMQQGAYMGSEYLQPSDTIKKAIDNGTLSFGFVGLAECLRALTGHDQTEGSQYQELGLSIVKHIRDKADKLTEDTHLNWSLIATPAESVAGTLLRKDKKEFGVIEGVTDRDYYTNSFHVSVFKKVKASEKIKLEAPYHELTNAGHITYIEMEGDPSQNLDALHALVDLMHDKGVGYFSFNAKMDTHTGCGYTGIINGDVCPNCGQRETKTFPIIRPRRVTGYLSYTTRFNDAKASEAKERVTHV